ncbi:hypothetical protein ACWD3I_24150 [Streptomyces sp. NPDC002817]|uniref:hypothetical protein n=1 Tax=Streptomyces sp. NPDC088357 TaxID=3154655 RepID=UPI00342BD846
MRTHTLVPTLLVLGALSFTVSHSSASSAVPDTSTVSAQSGSSTASSRVHDVDPSKIKGLRIVRDNSENSSCPFATSYPDVPGAQAMTVAMMKDVEQRLAIFRSTVCEDAQSGGEGIELDISHRFLVASGDVLGVRLTTQDRSAAGSGLSARTYWYDGKADAYRTAPGLVAGDSRDAFVAVLKARLKGREGVDAATLDDVLSDPASRAAVLDDMAFTVDGGLRVTFDRGDLGAPAAGAFRVTLPKKTITPWLSAFGERAQHQTVRPSGSLDLDAHHAPAPAVTTRTVSGGDHIDCKRVRCIAPAIDGGAAAPNALRALTARGHYSVAVSHLRDAF